MIINDVMDFTDDSKSDHDTEIENSKSDAEKKFVVNTIPILKVMFLMIFLI